MKRNKSILLAVAGIAAVFALLTGCEKEEHSMFGDIYGSVVNTMSGEPVRNASVMLSPLGKTTITGEDGSYQFLQLEAGSYTVQISSSGFRTNNKTIRVQPDVITRCDIALTPGQTEVKAMPAVIDFGTDAVRKTFTIYNDGSENLSWQAQYNSSSWIFEVSPKSGTLAPNANMLITVTADRRKLSGNSDMQSISLTTSAGDGLSVAVMIQKNIGGGGTGTDDPLPPSMTVTNGLAAYYTFEDTTNNTAHDEAHAIPISQPKFIEGAADGTKAISFSRSDNSYISVPEALIDGNNMSVSFWVKSIGDGHLFSVTTNRSANINKSFALFMENQQFQYAAHYADIEHSSRRAVFVHPTLNSAGWNMITLTSDYAVTTKGTVTAKLYINGQSVAVASEPISWADTDFGKGQSFQFGGGLSLGSFTIGALSMQADNLRIYNSRVLSAKEVKEIYDSEKPQ